MRILVGGHLALGVAGLLSLATAIFWYGVVGGLVIGSGEFMYLFYPPLLPASALLPLPFAIAEGLRRRRQWGWGLGLAMAVLGLAYYLVVVGRVVIAAAGEFELLVTLGMGMILAFVGLFALTVWYLTRPGVRRWFRNGRQRSAPSPAAKTAPSPR